MSSLVKPAHPGIVEFVDIIESDVIGLDGELTKNTTGVLMEAVRGGELSYHLFKQGPFSETVARTYFI